MRRVRYSVAASLDGFIADAAGAFDWIPFDTAVDFETLGEKGDELKDTVTLRPRDDGRQERVKIGDLLGLLLPQVV